MMVHQRHPGPLHDDPGRFTAFMLGQLDYLANMPMNHVRHGIFDEFRVRMYNAGWTQESCDHMEAVPPPTHPERKF
jgi:hypothetical protein